MIFPDNVLMRTSHALAIGQRIQKLRKIRGLTQVDLAAIANISSVHIGYVENGRRRPSLLVLERLARALKVSPRDLV